MSANFNVSPSPHIRDRVKSSNIMLFVVIALLPATFFGIYNFRHENAWLLVLVTTASAVLAEYIYEKLMHKPVTIQDFSAVVTGLLLALNLPPTLPLWMGALGSVFAIIVVKQLFGGLGQNFMNPALGARCFLLISFTGKMTYFVYDGVTGPTPLANLRAGEAVNTFDMMMGNIRGTIGETSVIAIMIGAMFLILMGVIDLRIPGTYIVTFVIFITLFGGHGFDPQYITAHLCGGGLMLGAWFMATDYVTSPITKTGINMDAVRLMGEILLEVAERSKDRDSVDCMKLVVFCNAPDDNPFMAGAFHGVTEADAVINVGVSGPGVVKTALEKVRGENFEVLCETIKKTAFKVTRVGQLVAQEASRRLSIPFGIIDLSLAPTPAIGDSVADILCEIGLEYAGAPGTTAALAMLNDQVKKGGVMASSYVGGLSGAFIPVSEDQGMIDSVQAGAITLV